MISWKKLNFEERERIELLFDSGERYKIVVFTEEPRIEFEDGTTIYIAGVND